MDIGIIFLTIFQLQFPFPGSTGSPFPTNDGAIYINTYSLRLNPSAILLEPNEDVNIIGRHA